MPAIFTPNFVSVLSLVFLCMAMPTAAQTLLQESLTVETETGLLHASLMRPKSPEPIPVALLVAGSGPTDRNGNSRYGANDNLKRLANVLSKLGVASVRYDKRGVGKSLYTAPDEHLLRADDYVNDIRLFIRQLRQDRRFSDVIVIGHSEGALLSSIATQDETVSALILIAGPGRPVATTLRIQLSRLPLSPALVQESQHILDGLEQGRLSTTVSDPLQPLFRESVQPYLISLFKYDPVKALRNNSAPVLIIQGDQDIQVSVEDAQLLAQAEKGAQLRIIQGMNHVLRIVDSPEAQWRSYNEPNRPIASELSLAIKSFLVDQGILPPSS